MSSPRYGAITLDPHDQKLDPKPEPTISHEMFWSSPRNNESKLFTQTSQTTVPPEPRQNPTGEDEECRAYRFGWNQ